MRSNECERVNNLLQALCPVDGRLAGGGWSEEEGVLQHHQGLVLGAARKRKNGCETKIFEKTFICSHANVKFQKQDWRENILPHVENML